MKKREAKYQVIFTQYLRKLQEKGEGYGYYELKQTTTDKFYFSKLEGHQEQGLIAAASSGFIWKLSDEDQRRKPFDCFSSPPLPSFVVIKFPDGFYVIKVGVLHHEYATCGKAFLNSYTAKKIAFKVIHI